MTVRTWLLQTAAAILSGVTLSAQVAVDPALPEYKAVAAVSGTITSVGSDTLNNLMTLWAEGFRAVYPNVQVAIEGKGSATAPPALIGGTAAFGPMSREMKQKEIDEFEARFGYKPTALPTSIDMLAVYVHRDNPVAGLSLPQIDALFSKSRKLGHPTEMAHWGQLGLRGAWGNLPVSLYGRNAASGTYGYFKEHALGKGDFKDAVKEQPGSSAVVQGVATDRGGIGYSGIGYKTADVRAVPVAAAAGEAFVEATPENAYTGEYPLARFLYVYMNASPGATLDPLRREFVRYIFSRQGQTDVVKYGYFPVTAEIARQALESVGIAP